MNVSFTRVYETSDKHSGTRVLADRLWPRGITKKDARIDIWAKDLAPSNELRKWFHADPEHRHASFVLKYKKELAEKKTVAKDLLKGKRKIVLVTAVRDVEQSHIPTLVAFLKRF